MPTVKQLRDWLAQFPDDAEIGSGTALDGADGVCIGAGFDGQFFPLDDQAPRDEG